MKMPYGKFKGKEMQEIPSGYLLWVAENWKEDTDLNKKICKESDEEWQYREKMNAHFESRG